jgi:hypothetical protein
VLQIDETVLYIEFFSPVIVLVLVEGGGLVQGADFDMLFKCKTHHA